MDLRIVATDRPWVVFVAAGTVLVVAGGLVAAAGGESPSRHLSWASAYLVLVCGVAQALVGAGQALVTSHAPRRAFVVAQFCTFNLANAGVVAGTLAGVTPLLGAASALLVVSLGLFAWATIGAPDGRRGLLVGYRGLLAVLVVSVPAGVLLAR